MKVWLRVVAVILINVCCILADITCQTGKFFKYELNKNDYSPVKDDKVSFKFSTEKGYPSLPNWVKLEQRAVDSKAYLYGAPNDWDKTSKIEVIGWDKGNDYSTKSMIEILDVEPNKNGYPWFQAEFFITNENLDVFLQKELYNVIVEIVKENYWPSEDLQCTGVETALGRGGRIPLPNTNDHEGVYVRVGSHENWKDAKPKVALETGKEPSKDFFLTNGNNFTIAWKSFVWLDLRKQVSPEKRRQQLLPKDKVLTTDVYAPREYDESARNFNPDFIFVIILPIIIIVILVILLSLIMCCGREGRKKRDEQTPNMQLTHHHNIQRSTYRLRELSKPQDHNETAQQQPPTPSSEERPRRAQNEYARLPEAGDEDRNEGRNAPPPYRMPPTEGATGGQQV